MKDSPELEPTFETEDGEVYTLEDAKALFLARSDFYRLLSSLFFLPLTQEQIDAMAGKDFSVFAELNDLCGEGANDIVRYLRKRNSGTRRELAADFTSVFGGAHTWKGRYATPYESLFEEGHGQRLFAASYRKVLAEYRAARVVKTPGMDYPEDHLSFMCEFLAIESDRAAAAIEGNNITEAKELVETSRAFLETHILSWFGRLEDLAANLITTRFYRGVMKIARGFFDGDFEQLGVLAEFLESVPEAE